MLATPSAHASAKERRALPAVTIVVMVIIALLSATVLRGIFSSPDTYANMYEKLNEKRDNVISLTTAATAASLAITYFGPDDTGTPVAEQLMSIAKDFSFILAAIVLEKYLLTVTGFAFFAVITPLCCAIVVIAALMRSNNPNKRVLQQAALKLFTLGLVLFITTPMSVLMAGAIDDTYQSSVDAVVEQASEIDEATDGAQKSQSSTNGDVSSKRQPANPLDVIAHIGGDVVDTVSSAVEGATDAVLGAIDSARTMVGNLIELFGVMLATSIVIPIIAPIVMYLAFKTLFGQQLSAAPQQVMIIPTQPERDAPTQLMPTDSMALQEVSKE